MKTMLDVHNKHSLCVIGRADYLENDMYDHQMAKRMFSNMEIVFGQIDSMVGKMAPEEGSWFLQNIVFNLNIRLGISRISREKFFESMSSMYELGQEVRKNCENNKNNADEAK